MREPWVDYWQAACIQQQTVVPTKLYAAHSDCRSCTARSTFVLYGNILDWYRLQELDKCTLVPSLIAVLPPEFIANCFADEVH
jgi:hypothetical protein